MLTGACGWFIAGGGGDGGAFPDEFAAGDAAGGVAGVKCGRDRYGGSGDVGIDGG